MLRIIRRTDTSLPPPPGTADMHAPTLVRWTTALFVCSLAIGCSGNKDSGGDSTGTHHVLAGFNHTWDFLSHRVSLSELAIADDGTITSGIIGGDFSTGDVASDFVHVRVTQSRITASDMYVGHGRVDVTVGPDGAFSETVTLTVPGISNASSATAALAGFRISTDTAQSSSYPSDYDPALGYTTKGWGFTVGEPTLSGDTATLTISGVKRWALTNNDADLADRSDMNGAIPHAQTELSVQYTVIGFEGALTSGSGSATVNYPNGNYSDQPPLTQSDMGIDIETAGTGFPIIQSYDLLLEDQFSDEWGDYIRSYGVELSDGDPLQVSAELTNSSALEIAAIRFTSTVQAGWVSLTGDAVVETVLTEGAHEIGKTSFAPDAPPNYER
jgi:hypothetical protein